MAPLRCNGAIRFRLDRPNYFGWPGPGAEGLGADSAGVDDGAEPVVVAGRLLAVCGPAWLVPARHQTPRPISTMTMMPMIQPPPPEGGRRGEFGSYVGMGFPRFAALAVPNHAAGAAFLHFGAGSGERRYMVPNRTVGRAQELQMRTI